MHHLSYSVLFCLYSNNRSEMSFPKCNFIVRHVYIGSVCFVGVGGGGGHRCMPMPVYIVSLR